MWKLREDLFQALTCNCSLLSPGYVYINFVRPDEAKLFLFAIEAWKILLLHCWSLFTVHGTARNWKIISIEQKISHNERPSICLVFLEITEDPEILVCWNLTRTRCTMDNFPVTQYLSILFIVHSAPHFHSSSEKMTHENEGWWGKAASAQYRPFFSAQWIWGGWTLEVQRINKSNIPYYTCTNGFFVAEWVDGLIAH